MKYKLTRNITPSVSHKKTDKNWIVIDGSGIVVGRLAAFLSHRLKGKHRSDYTSNIDNGDNVIVKNFDKVVLSGKKEKNKIYYAHSGFPGGLKSRTARFIREGKNPHELLQLAVKRMLGTGPMAYKRLKNLKFSNDLEKDFPGLEFKLIDFASFSRKNIR